MDKFNRYTGLLLTRVFTGIPGSNPEIVIKIPIFQSWKTMPINPGITRKFLELGTQNFQVGTWKFFQFPGRNPKIFLVQGQNSEKFPNSSVFLVETRNFRFLNVFPGCPKFQVGNSITKICLCRRHSLKQCLLTWHIFNPNNLN